MTGNKFIHDFLSTDKCVSSLKNIIENTIGKSVELEVRLLEDNVSFEEAFTDVEQYVKMK